MPSTLHCSMSQYLKLYVTFTYMLSQTLKLLHLFLKQPHIVHHTFFNRTVLYCRMIVADTTLVTEGIRKACRTEIPNTSLVRTTPGEV